MTPQQLQIGTALLTFLQEKHRGEASQEQYRHLFKEQGFDLRTEISPSIHRLHQKGLVEYRENGYFIRLTDKGHEAAELGLPKYLKQQKEAEDLEIREKRTSIRYTKWSFVLASVALLHSIYPVINIPELLGLNASIDADSNSEDREYDTQSTVSESFVSPEQIDEVKKALMHDSVFKVEFARELRGSNSIQK